MTLALAPDLGTACPSLIHHPGDLPAVLPHTVTVGAHGSLRGEYRCPCGRSWTCWWDAEAAGWPRMEAA